MTKGEAIPDHHHVLRYVPKNRLIRTPDGTVVGVYGQAFQRKQKDDGSEERSLSVNWVEFHTDCEKVEQIARSVNGIRSGITPTKKSGYAIGNVQAIKNVCQSFGSNVRVLHDPVIGNDGHSEIRRIPRDDLALLDTLAADVFTECVMDADVPKEALLPGALA